MGAIPLEGNECLEGAKGAYVNALAFVSTPDEYQQTVTDALQELHLFPFEFDEMEPFGHRAARVVLDAHLLSLAEETRRSGEVTFDEFHTFTNLDG